MKYEEIFKKNDFIELNIYIQRILPRYEVREREKRVYD